MPEAQIQDSAAGPVHDERQQDDGEDGDHQPEEEHDDSGDCVPGYCSRSSHGPQLPGAARLIPQRTRVIAEIAAQTGRLAPRTTARTGMGSDGRVPPVPRGDALERAGRGVQPGLVKVGAMSW